MFCVILFRKGVLKLTATNAEPRKAYPSDLTDAQWVIVEPLLPATKSESRPREVFNSLLY